MSFRFNLRDVERFLTFIDVLPNGCWFWTGGRSRGEGKLKWYGTFWVGGKSIRAHRFACEALDNREPLQKGDHRDHTCMFSLCVNPYHIVYVSSKTNVENKTQRGVTTIITKLLGVSFVRNGRIKLKLEYVFNEPNEGGRLDGGGNDKASNAA